jgi:hypothetical protein
MGFMDWARSTREQIVEPAAQGQTHQATHARPVNKLGATGEPAPAVIDALRPTGQPDISGGQRVEVRVTVTPVDGLPYQTTIMQSFLPSQMEDLSPGRTIGVTYDPDNPIAAVISTW